MSTTTLVQAAQMFEENLRAFGKANATIIAYTKDIEQMVEYLAAAGKVNISEVTSEDIENYKALLKTQRYTDKSISRKINSIKSLFRHLADQGLLEENPAKVVAQPHYEQAPPKVLSKNEYRALRDACRGDVRMLAIVELLLQTGMRISELAGLQVGDIDFERGIISINTQDTGVSRKVPLNELAKKAVQAYLKIRPRTKERTLFLTKTCKPFLIRNIRNSIDRYFRLAGLKNVRVNDLRHTFIVEQLRAGVPLVYVSQLVGHRRITTTEKYMAFVQLPDLSPDIKIETL
ncbi:MAG: tyrosine-type recombinase/integrase [Pseudomonadales bacterium]|jgi:site-specific recombinase XerD|nr:tyrosine-type recombinase/integrase [Pseudomonadales bacterium]